MTATAVTVTSDYTHVVVSADATTVVASGQLAVGSGLPAGGTVGQVVTNTGPGTGDWADPTGSGSGVPVGGTTGQPLRKNSNTDGDAGWGTITLAEISDAGTAASHAATDFDAAGAAAAVTPTSLGLVVGTNVEAHSARLDTLAATTDTGTGAVVRATSPALTTPTGVVKGDVGLGNVDNTSDANKPVSTAQAAADALRVPLSAFQSKGDLLVGTGASTYVRLPSSTDNFVLVSKASATSGLAFSDPATLIAGSFAQDISLVAGTTLTVTHNLSSLDVVVAVYDTSTNPRTDIIVGYEIDNTNSNVVKLTSAASYASARVVVLTGSGPQGPRGLTGPTGGTRVVNPATHTTTPWAINADVTDVWAETALGANISISAPTGTIIDTQRLQIRIFDSGTHTLTWNAAFNGGSTLSLPSGSVAGKTMYLAFQYNAATSKWDLLGEMLL